MDFNFDFSAFKNMKFDKLTNENKYSVLMILLNQIISLINIKELESDFIKQNVAFVKMKFLEEKLSNSVSKEINFKKSVVDHPSNRFIKLGINPASMNNTSKANFIINGHENIPAKYKIPLNLLKEEKLNLQKKLSIYDYQMAN